MEKSIQEIRILSGLQAGASLALSPGEYILGTGEQCDIILNDRQMLPQHARLIIDETAIHLHPQEGNIFIQGEALHDGVIAAGTLFRLGNTWLVIDDAAAVWPDIEAIFADMKPAVLTGSDVEQDNDGEPTFSDLDRLEATDNAPSVQAPVFAENTVARSVLSVPPVLRKYGLKVLLTVAVLTIAVLCIVLAFVPHAPDKALLAQQADNKNKQQIEQLLQNMHLRQRVTVNESKQRKLVVSGYLANERDMAALVSALAKLESKPEVRLFSEDNIVNTAKQVVLVSQLPIQVNNMGMGRIQLIGAAPDYENVDTLLQKLNVTVDGLKGIDSDVLVGDQLVAKLRQMIVDNGLMGKIALTINNGEAIINGALDVREMAQWEQLMAQFVSTYGTVLPIRATFPPSANLLPFKVLSAFSGDMPFVVTEQGEKVMLGGRIKGYTLVNITEQEIVFDGPRKIQIQR